MQCCPTKIVLRINKGYTCCIGMHMLTQHLGLQKHLQSALVMTVI
jgi:hypothetical protein